MRQLPTPNKVSLLRSTFLSSLFILCVALAGEGSAQTSKVVSWNVPTSNLDGSIPAEVAGYEIGVGAASGSYSQIINVGNVLSYSVSFSSDGQYFIATRAYDFAGNRGPFSNEGVVTISTNPPPQDSDGDGVIDTNDCAPTDASRWSSLAYGDKDKDGVRNSLTLVSVSCFGTVPPSGYTLNQNGPDNCPNVSNPTQVDSDKDGKGDACDKRTRTAPLDFTGDGLTDIGFATVGPDESEVHYYDSENGSVQRRPTDGGKAVQVPADYDGDGIADVATATLGPKRQIVWRAYLSAGEEMVTTSFGKSGDIILSGCDFDGDGSDELSYLRGRTLFTRPARSATVRRHAVKLATSYRSFFCADLTGDGVSEIVGVSRPTRKGVVSIVAFDLAGRVHASLQATKVSDVMAADVNGDEIDELFIIRRSSRTQSVVELYSVGQKHSQASYRIKPIKEAVLGVYAGENSATLGLVFTVEGDSGIYQLSLDSGLVEQIGEESEAIQLLKPSVSSLQR